MPAVWRPPPWLPWALCWIALALLLIGAGLRIALPEDPGDSVFFTLISLPGFALVALVGALIATRLPADPYGWLWCALALDFGLQAFGEGLRRAGVGASWVTGTLIGVSFMAGLCLFVFVLLLFPTGRLPGRPWRWLALAAIVVAGSAVPPYGLLSAGLLGLCLLLVALLRPRLEPLTGCSTVGVAGSTLAVAAVFNPARHRLQGAVDRRFDRARYDAARAVAAFAARLRDQVNLDDITSGLRDTITGTVAPASLSLWLSGPTDPRKR